MIRYTAITQEIQTKSIKVILEQITESIYYVTEEQISGIISLQKSNVVFPLIILKKFIKNIFSRQNNSSSLYNCKYSSILLQLLVLPLI